MRVIVVGAGEVGFHLAERLAQEHHDVVVIERDPDLAQTTQSQLDLLVVTGNGASPETLERAGIQGTELLLAVTNFDEANLIACLIAARYNVRLKIARVSNPEYYGRADRKEEKPFGADLLINPEFECAREIFKLFLRTAASDVAEFSGGRVILLALPVNEGAPVAGKTLAEIGAQVETDSFLTVAIDREGRSLIPDGSTRLQAGDEIYLVTRGRWLGKAYELLGLERNRIERVMLLGGGRVGLALARMLEREGIQPIILERDRARCRYLAETLDRALVLRGDATDIDLLMHEGVEGADGLAAVTSEDETNLLAALLSKHLGARKVIALLKRSEYIPLLTRVGIDAGVSPRLSTAIRILQHVRGGRILQLAVMERNRAEAMELEVLPDTRAAGRPVRDLELPQGAIIASLERGADVTIPHGDTVIQAGDRLVVFALPEAIEATAAFFS